MIYTGPGPTHFGVGPNNYQNGNQYYNQPNIPGYMPGYYNGNYNMYNPYYYQQIQEQRQREYDNYMKQQKQLNDRLSANASKFVNNETENKVDRYYYSNQQIQDINKHYQETQVSKMIDAKYRMANENKKYYVKDSKVNILRNIEYQYNQDKQIMPEDADLYEYMENGYKLNLASYKRELDRREQDLRNEYNQESYQRLLNMHNNIAGYSNNYDNIQPISIDDMEISLPSHIATNDEYIARRNAFINQIMSKQRPQNQR